MKKLFFFAICLFTYAGNLLLAQEMDEPIDLINPSFEGSPQAGTSNADFDLFGWKDCGFFDETPPDIHVGGNAYDGTDIFFGVTQKAQHGRTYLGMVTRPNDTWEAVAQQLERPLKKGQCYTMSIHLVRSSTYISGTKGSSQLEYFRSPINLKVWGGHSFCDRNEELTLSNIVVNTNWKEYVLKFEPQSDITHIILEASFQRPQPFPPPGNVLLDNASPVIPIACDEEDLLAVIEEEREKDLLAEAKPTSVDTPTADPVDEYIEEPIPSSYGDIADGPVPRRIEADPTPVHTVPPPPEKKIIEELDREKIITGQIIRIDQLYFDADSSSFTITSLPVLDEIYRFMKDNERVVVEIGGHTNQIPSHQYCDNLSKKRAQSVVNYLTQKGIESSRLEYKGYGKRKPIARANNVEARRKNQRVEIKILSLNG